jgi:hypothetical protein
MIKKLLTVVGILCLLSPWLRGGIGGLDLPPTQTLLIVGVIALVGAAILHKLDKRA